MSWALGCSLAVVGISWPNVRARVIMFLVVNAYGRRGRPTPALTFLGAVILGLQSYAQGYINQNPSWMPDGIDIATPLRLAIPVLFLFFTLLLLPNAPLRTHGLPRSRERAPKPTWRLALVGFAVLIAVVSVVSGLLGEGDIVGWSRGLAIAIIMLSLVPLTGYGGQISLAQMSFAGIGAFTAARLAEGSIIGIIGSGGRRVGRCLPALRLRGIYLALATLAFAYFVEKVVFTQRALVGAGSKPLARLQVGPVDFSGGRSYMILLAVVFSLVGIAVVAIRLGPFGRRLQAMKDSPAACATLGLNLTITKMQVFILSAAIAGLGGAMLAGVQTQAQVDDFGALQNLPVLLMAVAGGIALVSGALFGGLLYASFAIIAKHLPIFEIFGVEARRSSRTCCCWRPRSSIASVATRTGP
jgi:branched-chain amino acid transport system permease protein